MKKKFLAKIIMIIMLLITGVIIFSEKIHKIEIIENIKKVISLRGNYY